MHHDPLSIEKKKKKKGRLRVQTKIAYGDFYSLVVVVYTKNKNRHTHYLYFMQESHLADTHTHTLCIGKCLPSYRSFYRKIFFHRSFRMNKRLNWIYIHVYIHCTIGRKRIIIFYNAIYIYIKKFNWTKVSLNSSKSYTYTAGDRLFINRIYICHLLISKKKKKKAFLLDMKRLDKARYFSKEFFSFVHQFLTRAYT